MKSLKSSAFAINSLLAMMMAFAAILSGCSTPTLVEITRQRLSPDDPKTGKSHKDDLTVPYKITDLDVLNYTDEVKRDLAKRGGLHEGAGYTASAAQTTLGALAGAAQTAGWGASTASGLGMGATYVFGLGRIFDPKGHSQAYEQAYTAIQAAEATYYFHAMGMGFDANGKVTRVNAVARKDIPSDVEYTPDGETLYYRVSKILKVLEDALQSKIPDLKDLKDAQGEETGSSPAVPVTAVPRLKQPVNPVAGSPTPSPATKKEILQGKAAVFDAEDAVDSAKKTAAFYTTVMKAAGVDADAKYERTADGFFSFVSSLQDAKKLDAVKAAVIDAGKN